MNESDTGFDKMMPALRTAQCDAMKSAILRETFE